jgi:hypothetical protein
LRVDLTAGFDIAALVYRGSASAAGQHASASGKIVVRINRTDKR